MCVYVYVCVKQSNVNIMQSMGVGGHGGGGCGVEILRRLMGCCVLKNKITRKCQYGCNVRRQ